MKCQFCNKNIDEIDCSCKMCTICGWTLDLSALNVTENKIDQDSSSFSKSKKDEK